MWLIDRLLAVPAAAFHSAAAAPTETAPQALPEAHARRLGLKRPARAGRMAISPWQKVAAPARRSRH